MAFATLLFCSTFGASAQVNLYVDSSRSASGAGTSWATAYKTLNEALDIANGGVISTAYNVFVAKGTYYPPGLQSSTDREGTFAILRGGIRVYGGYPAGGGPRAVLSNPTILSGAIGNAADSADNSYHVVVISTGGFNFSSDSTILDGFSVTRGAGVGGGTTNFGSAIISQNIGGGIAIATGRRILLRDCQIERNYASGNGGGIHLEADSVEMVNCTVSNNRVLGYGAGGGIANRAGGLLRIRACSFSGNRGQYGGALFTNVSASRLSIADCSFTANVGGYVGGAMQFADSVLAGDFLLENCTFTGNVCLDGGGGGAISWRNLGGASPYTYRVRQCSFVGNKVTYSGGSGGGALAYSQAALLKLDTCQFIGNTTVGSGGGLESFGPTTVTGCTFQADSAFSGSGGGAFFGHNPVVSGCTFTGCFATGGGGLGMTYYTSSATLTDCIVEGNSATMVGGGIMLNGATITRCRIRGNRAGETGGGLYLTAGATVNNTLFSGNWAGNSGGAAASTGWMTPVTFTNCTMAGNSAPGANSIHRSTGHITVNNCLLWDGPYQPFNTPLGNGNWTVTYTTIQAGFSGAGNNMLNPLFVNPLPSSAAPTTGGDYTLTSCSPAVNTGQNSGSYTGITDAAGAPRLVSTVVDRGAYEFQGVGLNPVAVGAITGDSIVCLNGIDTLYNAVTGGVWSSSNPSVATVSPTGVVSGLALGTTVISYTHGTSGCAAAMATRNVAVTAPAALGPILGTDSVCATATIQLTPAAPGGVWTSSSNAIATVNAAGVVTGVSAGMATITYRYGPVACSSTVTKVIKVNPLPVVPAITGNHIACTGGTVQYANAMPGGVWGTMSNGTIATISPAGVLTGVAAGSDHVTYTVTNSSGCSKTVLKLITVCTTASTPNPILGRDTICAGDTANLTLYTSPFFTGTFTSSNPSVATVANNGSSLAIVTGVAPGTVTISVDVTNYSWGNCVACSTIKTKTIVVLPPPPAVAAITGGNTACMGSTLQLGNTTAGGVWTTTSGGTRSTVSSTGLVTPVSPGTDTVRYILANGGGCSGVSTKVITISAPQLTPISGTTSLCAGATAQFSHASAGGAWTSFNTTLGSVNTGGLYTSVASGIDTVYYLYTSNGCPAQVKTAVTIHALPTVSSITGADSVCAGQTLSLSNTTTGGTWSSANPSFASVGSTGLVSGISQGLAGIGYTVTSPQGCATSVSKDVYVKALPTVSGISGAATLCVNATGSYTNGTAGGQWSTHSNGSISSVSSSGMLTAVAAGVDTIRYTITNSLGCVNTAKLVVTVTAPQLTAITAPDSICLGAVAQLSHPVSGGAWTNFSTGFGTVSSTGLYISAAVGTDTVSYQYASNGCPAQAKKAVRIAKPDTAVIAGNALVCKGGLQPLTASIPGGTWSSSNNTVATVSTSGQVSGVSGGSAVISYVVSSPLGCSVTSVRSIAVNAPVTTTSQNGATLTATGNQPGAAYQWLNCTSNYQSIAGATAPVYTAPSNGQYAVVVSHQGCTDTSICLTVFSASVDDAIRKTEVVISYVTRSQLMINTGNKVPAMLRLFDAQGKLVKEMSPASSSTLLDASDVAKGMYILHLYFRDQRVVSKVNIQ